MKPAYANGHLNVQRQRPLMMYGRCLHNYFHLHVFKDHHSINAAIKWPYIAWQFNTGFTVREYKDQS